IVHLHPACRVHTQSAAARRVAPSCGALRGRSGLERGALLMNGGPLILDFDGACGPTEGAVVLPLQGWQEAVRFGCSLSTFRALWRELDAMLPAAHGPVLMGSGDFHHLSWPLIERLRDRGPFRVVVF